MKLYPYALFDMDGTMTDSMPFWENAGTEYLAEKGLEPKAGLWEAISSKTFEEVADLFHDDYGITDDMDTIAAGINRIMEKHYRYDIPIKPGVADYLKYLHENGVKLGVCSATAVHLVEMTLGRLDVLKYFDCITSCEESGGKSKVYPDVFNIALEKLGAPAEETVMYEDAPFGIRTASGLGIHVCRVYDDSYKDGFDNDEKCYDCFVKDFSSLTFCPQEVKQNG